MAEMCRKCGSAIGSFRHAAACGVTKTVTAVTPAVTPITNNVTLADRMVTSRVAIASAIFGEHICPTCGELHRVAMTNGERQRAYRERKRG